MHQKTRGIVLGFIKFRETSIIVNIYTESYGLQAYIVKGIRSKSKKQNIALFQPLSLLDIDAIIKPGNDIHYFKEYRLAHNYIEVLTNHVKCAIALFLSEILQKILKEHTPNPELFNFIWEELISLDKIKENVQDFHLSFMIKLSQHLGIGIFSINDYYQELNMRVELEEMAYIESVIDLNPIPSHSTIRVNALEKTILWYQHHYNNIGAIHSLDVLKSIFH